jgi:hypothetical protein
MRLRHCLSFTLILWSSLVHARGSHISSLGSTRRGRASVLPPLSQFSVVCRLEAVSLSLVVVISALHSIYRVIASTGFHGLYGLSSPLLVFVAQADRTVSVEIPARYI